MTPGRAEENLSTHIKKYASSVFKESSVGIVSSFAHAGSASRRIFKTVALVLCLAGFIYQSAQFLIVYFQYPTNVNIEITYPDVVEIPAYTFCDNNGVSRRIFCQKYPDRCEKPDYLFCKKHEYYCGGNNTLVPKTEYFQLNSNLTLVDMIELNVPKEIFFKQLVDDKSDLRGVSAKGPYLRKRDRPDPSFLCYSLYDRVSSPLEPRRKSRRSYVYNQAYDIMEFRVPADDMFLPGNRAGVLFALHSPFEAVNPFDTGIFMKSGRMYKILVSMEEENLLEKPYVTDCVNYTEIWEENNRSGPRIQEMCKQKCLAELSLKCFNCVSPILFYPMNASYCFQVCDSDTSRRKNDEEFEFEAECHKNSEVSYKLAQACSENCKNDCRRIRYIYKVQERFRGNFDKYGRAYKDTADTIRVEIFFNQDEVIVLKHLPKYMFVELFSMIGGFIGIWLGINLLDITDIFEGFFRISRFTCSKRKK